MNPSAAPSPTPPTLISAPSAGVIDAEHLTDYRRLLRSLQHGPPFQLLVCEFNDERYRNGVIAELNMALAARQGTVRQLTLRPEQLADVNALERMLIEQARDAAVIQLLGADHWFSAQQGQGRWRALNLRRDALAQTLRCRLLLWLTEAGIRDFAEQAPDFWSWRSGVYRFSRLPVFGQASVQHRPATLAVDDRPAMARRERIAVLRQALSQMPPLAAELQLKLGDELAGLLEGLGQLDDALQWLRERQLPLCDALSDFRFKALTLSKIADILQVRGQLDEALRIRVEEEVPVYESLGDRRSLALTRGRIADILAARGQLDEALRILREEVAPGFDSLGDRRSLAEARGRIADILEARGQLDEALRIRADEQAPVFESLGDWRSLAVARGRIADILAARGQLDEALRIRMEEELPVYELLGDRHSLALTRGRIADILEARGQLDEALRIRMEEELPVYESLGDRRSLALTRGQIADTLRARGQLDEALRILVEEVAPVLESLGDRRSLAVMWGRIADIERLQGRVAEAAEHYAMAQRSFADLGMAAQAAEIARRWAALDAGADQTAR